MSVYYITETEAKAVGEFVNAVFAIGLDDDERMRLVDVADSHARRHGVDVEQLYADSQSDPLLYSFTRHWVSWAALLVVLAEREGRRPRGARLNLAWIEGPTLRTYCPKCSGFHAHGAGGSVLGVVEGRAPHCADGGPDYDIVPLDAEVWPKPTAEKPGRGRKPRGWRPNYGFH